jgi:hypothetical protein
VKLERNPDAVEAGPAPIELDPARSADHALRNILTLAAFYEPEEDDVQETLAAIRSIARRALFSKTA